MPELGLWYYKARFDSPTTGRFLQTDPVGYEDQVNLYAYVGNDPMNHTDPSGTFRCYRKIETVGGFKLVDLAGKAHYSKDLGRMVSTPHVQAFRENVVNGVVKSGSRVGDAVPATMRDLQRVEDTLRGLKY